MQLNQHIQAAIQARQKLIKNRENRAKVKQNALSYELYVFFKTNKYFFRKPTLYNEFLKMLSKAERLALGEDTSANDAILEKYKNGLEKMQKSLANVEKELEESKEKLKVIPIHKNTIIFLEHSKVEKTLG